MPGFGIEMFASETTCGEDWARTVVASNSTAAINATLRIGSPELDLAVPREWAALRKSFLGKAPQRYTVAHKMSIDVLLTDYFFDFLHRAVDKRRAADFRTATPWQSMFTSKGCMLSRGQKSKSDPLLFGAAESEEKLHDDG